MRKMLVTTARLNLLEENRQVEMMILDNLDDAHSSANWALVA
jgi:hypothetical protein